ncbi:MAG: helix-turn-helix domain-containing protein [Cellvibrionaceae bacterium]|nr:helix-turn-helix domain-containing protein [Cellvibrionaceae bacterium]
MSDQIATRLQHVRQMYGLSQRELAKRAGVTNSSVSMIEQGRVSPSFSSLEKLLKGIPMTVRDFFNLDYEKDSQCFYRSFEIFAGSDEGVDSYHLSKNKTLTGSGLIYQVYNPSASTGDAMRVAQKECSGFIVQGQLEVTINSRCQLLESGDGFSVEMLSPYRLRNISEEKAIVVLNNHALGKA